MLLLSFRLSLRSLCLRIFFRRFFITLPNRTPPSISAPPRSGGGASAFALCDTPLCRINPANSPREPDAGKQAAPETNEAGPLLPLAALEKRAGQSPLTDGAAPARCQDVTRAGQDERAARRTRVFMMGDDKM